jgi:hypothetical protein
VYLGTLFARSKGGGSFLSYDFELFSSRSHALEGPFTSTGSILRIDGPDRVEDEDLPDNFISVLGGKRFLFRIHLEGEFTLSDKETVNAWLGEIVRETKGVLIDLQTERFETPTTQGYLEPQSAQPCKSGRMSFYFRDAERFYDRGFEETLRHISLLMPEAAPARFGEYEPLQSRVKDCDFSELISAYKADTSIIMQGKAPFGHISHWVPCHKTGERYHPRHFMRTHFALGELCFEIRPKLFAHPVQLKRLTTLFETLCVALDVVYAEITETNARAHFLWRGLPDNAAHTICLGPAYQSTWPGFQDVGYKVSEYHQVVTSDRLGSKPPRPPEDLRAPFQENGATWGKPKLARIFPFDYEYDPSKNFW